MEEVIKSIPFIDTKAKRKRYICNLVIDKTWYGLKICRVSPNEIARLKTKIMYGYLVYAEKKTGGMDIRNIQNGRLLDIMTTRILYTMFWEGHTMGWLDFHKIKCHLYTDANRYICKSLWDKRPDNITGLLVDIDRSMLTYNSSCKRYEMRK